METQTATPASSPTQTTSVEGVTAVETKKDDTVKRIPWANGPTIARTQRFGQESKAQAKAPENKGEQTRSESKEQTTEAKGEAGQKTETKPAVKKFKIGSKEFDPADEKSVSEATEHLKNWERTLQRNMQQMAQFKKQFESMDFDQFFKMKGKNADEWAEEILIKKLEQAQLTPEQRELKELQAWKKAQEEQEIAAKTAKEQEEQDRQTQEFVKKNNEEFMEVWKSSGLPAHHRFGAYMAAELARSHKLFEKGMIDAPLTVKEAASKVKQEWQDHVRKYLGTLEPKQLQEVLGEKPLLNWRQFNVKEVESKLPSNSPKTPQYNRPENYSASNKIEMSENEVRAWRDAGRPPMKEFLRTFRKQK